MEKLIVGIQLTSESHKKLVITEELGRGGQSIIYRITVDGKSKILNWYGKAKNVSHRQHFYENIKNLISLGAPTSGFLWPQDSVVSDEGCSFGYITEMLPSDYVCMTKYLLGHQKFDSLHTLANAMINIAQNFRLLHIKGLCFCNVSDSDIYINPHNGDVLIYSNDNIASPGYSASSLGKCRYMAPEIVLEQKSPDKSTDCFSLALLLFMLSCRAHPLEGAGTTPPCMTPSIEKYIYGSNPVFIFDPSDDSNRPIRGIHGNAIIAWPKLPDHLRFAFERAFSKNAMTYYPETRTYAAPRLTAREWLDVLLQFRNSIILCSCKSEVLINGNNCVCPFCGKRFPLVSSIKTSRYTIPVYPGVKVMHMHIENCSTDHATIPVAEVTVAPERVNDPYSYSIKNISEEIWHCTTASGQQRFLQPGEAMPAKPGIKVCVNNGRFEVI